MTTIQPYLAQKGRGYMDYLLLITTRKAIRWKLHYSIFIKTFQI